MNLRIFLIALVIMLAVSQQSIGAQVPPIFINSVVAIGGIIPDAVAPDGRVLTTKWATIGTGFFYGHLAQADPDIKKRRYNVYLVTAKHVTDAWKTIQAQNKAVGDLKIRVNPIPPNTATEFSIKDLADPGSNWSDNPNGKDISVISSNLELLTQKLSYQVFFFPGDEFAADIAKLKSIQVSAGDGVFVLGFPMGQSGVLRNYVIVRQGVIAKIDEMLDKASDSFMIDSLVFPGNSGGPVVLKADINAIQGTTAQSRAFLIGVVKAYEPYTDVAVSAQTLRPRVIFEENSGLAEVLPIDYVEDAIRADLARSKP
jgi:hypothetical protein